MRPTAASFAGSMCMRSFASASSTRTCTTRPNLLQDAEARARREVRRRSREAKPLRPPRPPRSGRHARVDLQRVPREGLRDPRRLHGGLRQARLIAVRHTRGSRRRGVRSIFEGGARMAGQSRAVVFTSIDTAEPAGGRHRTRNPSRLGAITVRSSPTASSRYRPPPSFV